MDKVHIEDVVVPFPVAVIKYLIKETNGGNRFFQLSTQDPGYHGRKVKSSRSLEHVLTPHAQSRQRRQPLPRVHFPFLCLHPKVPTQEAVLPTVNMSSHLNQCNQDNSPTKMTRGPSPDVLDSVNWQSTLIIINGLLEFSTSKGSASVTHHESGQG